MQTKYVYMLYEHDEHGPEGLVATLDRTKLPQMLQDHWGPGKVNGMCSPVRQEDLQEAADTLRSLLMKSDDELADQCWKCFDEWGGLALDVVTLV